MASLVHRKLPSNFKQSQLQTQKDTYLNIFFKKSQYTLVERLPNDDCIWPQAPFLYFVEYL